MKRTYLAIALVLTGALTACGPLGVAAGGPSPVASKKPKAGDGAKDPATTAVTPDAAGILGKMKEPVGLARQAAFVASLHDALPMSIASGGIGTLSAAGSMVSNNGGGLISNNGGALISDAGAAWRLLQAPTSLLPEYTNVRADVVLHQKPESLLGAVLSLYDVKTFDRTPGADNEGALIDRFRMEVTDVRALDDGLVSFDIDLKVVTSKRVPFADKLILRQTGRLSKATGRYESVKMEYFLGFDVALPDGGVDLVDLRFVAGPADLAPALDQAGQPTVSYEARRMDVTGTNGHGDYEGEARFPPGGDIVVSQVHVRPDGAESRGEFTLRADGTSTQVAISMGGQLSLTTERRADGARALAVRDLAGPEPVELPGVITEADGIGTFDFGAAGKVRARLR